MRSALGEPASSASRPQQLCVVREGLTLLVGGQLPQLPLLDHVAVGSVDDLVRRDVGREVMGTRHRLGHNRAVADLRPELDPRASAQVFRPGEPNCGVLAFLDP